MHKSRDLPSLELLKAFEVAARRLSFTRAGDELFLSQSAVSRQIQQLETQLGTPLFIRRTRALLLTESGQRYYRDVSQALNQLRAAGASLAATPTGRLVTVTTTVTFASLWLVPNLADFQQQHPDVEVRIAADNAVRDLEGGQLDVAIRYATRQRWYRCFTAVRRIRATRVQPSAGTQGQFETRRGFEPLRAAALRRPCAIYAVAHMGRLVRNDESAAAFIERGTTL